MTNADMDDLSRLEGELDARVRQRDHYQRAIDTAVDPRSSVRLQRNLERLEDEIAGLEDARRRLPIEIPSLEDPDDETATSLYDPSQLDFMVPTNSSSRRPISELALDDIVADVSTPQGSLQRGRDPYGPVPQLDAPAVEPPSVPPGSSQVSALRTDVPSWPQSATEPGVDSPFGSSAALRDPGLDALLPTSVSEREEWSVGSRVLLALFVAVVFAGIAWIIAQ